MSAEGLPYMDQCPCVCHKQTGVMHVAPCCRPRLSIWPLGARKAVKHALQTTELWRDMDGPGTLQTYGVEDREFDKLADAVIATLNQAENRHGE